MEKHENNCLHKINELARGSSVQAKASNQYWLALIVVAIASIIPAVDPDSSMITLPFRLGEVTEALFYTVCLVILSGLSIAYTNAHIEVSRIKDEIEKVVAELKRYEKGREPHVCDCRNIDDILNSSIIPNFNKVASIPLYFFPPSKWEKMLADEKTTQGEAWRWWFQKANMYGVLKFVSWVFTYGIPGYALVTCCIKGWDALSWLALIPVIFIALIGFLALFAMFCVDVRWTRRGILRWKKPYLKRFEPEEIKEKAAAD